MAVSNDNELAGSVALLSPAEQAAILARVRDQVMAAAVAAGLALFSGGWERRDRRGLYERSICLTVTDPLQPVLPGHLTGYALFIKVKAPYDGRCGLHLDVFTHDMSFTPARIDLFRVEAQHAVTGTQVERRVLRSAACRALDDLANSGEPTRLAQQAVALLVDRWAP